MAGYLIEGGHGFIGRASAPEPLATAPEARGLDAPVCQMDGPIMGARGVCALARALEGALAALHLAAGTSVTTSLEDPARDVAIEAHGRARRAARPRRDQCELRRPARAGDGACRDRSPPVHPRIRTRGGCGDWPLRFHSPFRRSKGAANQSFIAAAASPGRRRAALGMSGIRGPRQFAAEDQGWVAHLLLRVLTDGLMPIFDDVRQVREILDAANAGAACRAVLGGRGGLSGRASNRCDGPDCAVSQPSFVGRRNA